MKITGSLVTYHNNFNDIQKVIDSFLNTQLDVTLFISDNSESDDLKSLCTDKRIIYTFNNSNKGFGHGHNIAIKKAQVENSDIHLVINPDIYFNQGTIEKIVDFMNNNENVGLMMPKILYPNGEIQYVCKLLPHPFNLFSRGFIPQSWKWVQKINDRYEMKFTNYKDTMRVPYISGCFMVFRTKIFNEIGYFDENIFMYLEETDLTRRVMRKYDTVMYPKVEVYHKWEKATHKSFKYKKITIKSAVYYFNKWGWFFDKERKNINNFVKKSFLYKSDHDLEE